MLSRFKMYYIVIITMCSIRFVPIFNLYTCSVPKNCIYKNDLIELLRIKILEIYKSGIYNGIFHAKPYLDTI